MPVQAYPCAYLGSAPDQTVCGHLATKLAAAIFGLQSSSASDDAMIKLMIGVE